MLKFGLIAGQVRMNGTYVWLENFLPNGYLKISHFRYKFLKADTRGGDLRPQFPKDAAEATHYLRSPFA